MSTARWEQIKQVFNAAMEKPAAERAAFVDTACAGDAELRSEVDSLMRAARPTVESGGGGGGGPVQTGGAARAMGRAMASATTASYAASPLTEAVGTTVGPYKLLQVIGEGGFGTVFLADQSSPVRRRVALKIIKLGMDTKQVVARFEAERQALALMDHSNIAKVFDAGSTESGRPFFVMEYVKGDPITTFADAHTLTLRERLELLTQVCLAVQHAHQKGIIHRDIKPSNVLVSMVDGKPLAKVIDFGIAKATGAAGGTLTDKTLFTEHRALIGTPEYMSPEQAEGSPDIDTRTDVYGLGVLMYELLTGTTPFEPSRLRSAAYAEMQRIIREEEPPSPSLRITRDVQRDLGKLASTAAQRKVEPQKLNALMRGELDWIVMKALDKDRGRRFATPQELAADIDRHLRGEAVVAAPASAGYRVRKFVRRNKGAVGAVSAVTVALLIGIAGMTWGLLRAERARDVVAATAARASATLARSAFAKDAPNVGERALAIAQENPNALNEALWARWESVRNAGLVSQTKLGSPDGVPIGERVQQAPWINRRLAWILDDGKRVVYQADRRSSFVDWRVSGGPVAHSGTDLPREQFEVALADGTRLIAPEQPGQFGPTIRRRVQWLSQDGALLGEQRYPDGVAAVRSVPGNDCVLLILLSGRVLQLTPDGKRLSERPLATAPASGVLDVALSTDKRYLFALDADLRLLTFNVSPESDVRQIEAHADSVRRIRFDATGTKVLTLGYDGWAKLWSFPQLQSLGSVFAGGDVSKGQPQTGHGVGLADGTWLVTSMNTQPPQLWSVQGVRQEANPLDWPSPISVVASNPLSSSVAVAQADWGRAEKKVFWFDQPRSALRLLKTYRGVFPYAMAVSPKDHLLFVALHPFTETDAAPADTRGDVDILNVTSGELVGTLKHHRLGLRDVDVSRDGQLLGVCSIDGTATIWDIGRRRVVHELLVNPGISQRSAVSGGAFHPILPVFATASHDNRIVLWSTESGCELAVIDVDRDRSKGFGVSQYGGLLKEVRFSPDGRYLLAAVGKDLWTMDLFAFDSVLRAQAGCGIEDRVNSNRR